MLTGELLFEGETPMAMIIKHVSETPGSPSRRSPYEIPDDLDQLILQLLAKDPDERPPSAEALERALLRIPGDPWTEAEAEEWWAIEQPTLSRGSEVSEMTDSATLVRAVTN
jgi:serine/threonine protein kinase